MTQLGRNFPILSSYNPNFSMNKIGLGLTDYKSKITATHSRLSKFIFCSTPPIFTCLKIFMSQDSLMSATSEARFSFLVLRYLIVICFITGLTQQNIVVYLHTLDQNLGEFHVVSCWVHNKSFVYILVKRISKTQDRIALLRHETGVDTMYGFRCIGKRQSLLKMCSKGLVSSWTSMSLAAFLRFFQSWSQNWSPIALPPRVSQILYAERKQQCISVSWICLVEMFSILFFICSCAYILGMTKLEIESELYFTGSALLTATV